MSLKRTGVPGLATIWQPGTYGLSSRIRRRARIRSTLTAPAAITIDTHTTQTHAALTAATTITTTTRNAQIRSDATVTAVVDGQDVP